MNNYKLNILIAEDDRDDAATLIEALKSILPSSHCIVTKDGIECLRYLKTNNAPDLVFLDLNMPLKNGLSALRDIYNQELLPDTPIAIYSTSQNMKDIDEAYNYKAQFYIVKPISFTGFKDILKKAVTILGKPLNEKIAKSNFVLREENMNTV